MLFDSGSNYGLAVMDQAIYQQAQMIAYLNDFKLMFVATLLVVPLVLLIRPARHAPEESLAHAAMD
jgi:MFS transporter, DHA2 family, multidrug resistance protein